MTDKRPPISPEQSEKIAKYRESGCSIRWIAQKLNLSHGAVSWHCLRYGIESPKTTSVPEYRGPMVMARGHHIVRRFSQDEDAIIVDLEAQGIAVNEIAKRLGRRHNSVIGRLATLARRVLMQRVIAAGGVLLGRELTPAQRALASSTRSDWLSWGRPNQPSESRNLDDWTLTITDAGRDALANL